MSVVPPGASVTMTVMSEEPPRDERPWDERILALVDAGVDGTSIVENLRRTPTERLRRMQDMARFIEDVRDRRSTAA